MGLAKATFFLPVKDNQGRDLASEIHVLQSELFARFFGWSWEGNVKGAYRMADGRQAVDENAKFMVILDEARLDEIEEILVRFKERCTQEKILLEVQHNLDIRFL